MHILYVLWQFCFLGYFISVPLMGITRVNTYVGNAYNIAWWVWKKLETLS